MKQKRLRSEIYETELNSARSICFFFFPVWSFDNRDLIPESFCLFCPCLQVLPLVPPGRTSGEDGSPYSGQVIVYANRIDFFRFGVNLVCSLACLFMAVI